MPRRIDYGSRLPSPLYARKRTSSDTSGMVPKPDSRFSGGDARPWEMESLKFIAMLQA